MIRAILRALFGCDHAAMIRERRTVHGVDIPHYVCPICDYSEPVIARTKDEHERMREIGSVKPLTSRPVTASDRARALQARASKIRRFK